MKQAKGRILCVDNDQDTREMISAVLGCEGYEVIAAQNVADGLRQGVTDNFDVILLDWVFNDGTGIELCKELRNAGTSTTVLFYSGRSDARDIENAMSVGAQGFLIKPVESAQLFATLNRFLSSENESA